MDKRRQLVNTLGFSEMRKETFKVFSLFTNKPVENQDVERFHRFTLQTGTHILLRRKSLSACCLLTFSGSKLNCNAS